MKSQSDLVKKYFEDRHLDWQSIYDEKYLASRIIQQREYYVLMLFDTLDLPSGSKVLDIGCGAGLMSKKLLERGHNVIGIDISENMLALARNNCKNVNGGAEFEFLKMDVENLNLEVKSFDVVIATGLIEYLEWDRWALQQMYNVLKPGGHLIVTAPNRIRLSYIFDPFQLVFILKELFINTSKNLFKQIVGTEIQAKLGYYRRKIPKRKTLNDFKRKLYTLQKIKFLLIEINFSIVNSLSHGFGPFRLFNFSNNFSIRLNQLLENHKIRSPSKFLMNKGENLIVLAKKNVKSFYISKTNANVKFNVFENILISENKRLKLWLKLYGKDINLDLKNLVCKKYRGENILVISPHPDDEIIGCGGTIIKLIKNGANVTVLHLTDGSKSDALINTSKDIRHIIRLHEAQKVADQLGIDELIFWKIIDNDLKPTKSNCDRMSQLLNKMEPRLIFLPFINDLSSDHKCANLILFDALKTCDLSLNSIDIFSYEIWSLVPTNSITLIEEVFEEKIQLLMQYPTAMKDFNYIKYCQILALHKSIELLDRKTFIESFFRISASEYLKFLPITNS